MRYLPFAFLISIAALLPFAHSASAQKANVAYFEDAPQPIGKITPAQIDALAASEFSHVIFAFVNLCTIAPDGTHCVAPVDPQVVWNIAPVHDAGGQPFADAQAAMKKLTDAGKTLYMSIGAASNNETWDFLAGATAAERAAAAQKLQAFMADYHVTGVDFDFEAGDAAGFGVLATLLAGFDPVPPLSMAPYNTSPPAQGDATSTQWQYCEMAKAGGAPTLINRQYYSGGYCTNTGTGPVCGDIVAQMKLDLAPFDCTIDGTARTLSIPVDQMNPGIGVSLSQLPSDKQPASPANCQNSTTSTPVFDSCAQIVAPVLQAFPDIAGVALWDIDGLLQSGVPTYLGDYACVMANALNGTKIACN